MNELCEDTQRHIIRLCGKKDVKSLSNTSKIWPFLIRTSILGFSGPINGTTFDRRTFEEHGPVFMPHVTTVVVDSYDVIEGLEALQLHTIRRPLNLVVNLNVLNDPIAILLSTIKWSSVTLKRVYAMLTYRYLHSSFLLQTESLSANALDFDNLQLSGLLNTLRSLTLFGFDNGTYSNTFIKIFSLKLESLELYGVLTDAAIYEAVSTVGTLPTLKTLRLNNEGICSWVQARQMQSFFPNIEHFSLRSSNLLRSDLDDNFDFSLWPHLKSLDFNNNYTLNISNFQWPPLESLKILNCKVLPSMDICVNKKSSLTNFLSINACITELSINCYPSTIKEISGLPHLKKLHLSLLSYLRSDLLADFSFLSKLELLQITFQEKLEVSVYMKNIRRLCPNTLVQQVH
jgi:hypothetical protein